MMVVRSFRNQWEISHLFPFSEYVVSDGPFMPSVETSKNRNVLFLAMLIPV